MLQAFIIMSREGLESFLIVAIILAFLRKTGRPQLLPVVYGGIVSSVLLSLGLGFVLMEVANQSLWEGILAVVAALMVGSLVIHMWRVGPHLKLEMEKQLADISQRPTSWAAASGVFIFTVLMITREGMETTLMLYQVKNQNFILGGLMGVAFAVGIAWLWIRFSHLVNLKRFFQVTGAFLMVFVIQISVYAFHEFTEAGIFSQSEAWHAATEPFAPDGMYGKWFSFVTVGVMGGWLVVAALRDQSKRRKRILHNPGPHPSANNPA